MRKSVAFVSGNERYIGLLGQRNFFDFFCEMLVLLLRTSFHEAYSKIYSKDKLDRGYGYTF